MLFCTNGYNQAVNNELNACEILEIGWRGGEFRGVFICEDIANNTPVWWLKITGAPTQKMPLKLLIVVRILEM